MARTTEAPGLRRGATAVFALVVAAWPAGCLSGSDGEPVATDRVTIPGPWVFEPAAIQVINGTEVTWTNHGGQPHTVTFDSLGIDEIMKPGASIRLKFAEPGQYSYGCRFHPPDMGGTVQVVAARSLESGESAAE